ncbi:MAG: extracellular solute-binding protein [Chloroflexota bacterium]|nr:extracellular solute-binding protein [Chloroflexota bacterium]
MLTRRALIASTAALAAGCSSLESAFSVPNQPRTIDLTWISEAYGGFRERGLGPNGLEETLKHIVAALEEDIENPNGPAKARYTLTSRFVRSENADPPLQSIDDVIAWYGGLEADLLSVPPFLAQLLGERGVILSLDQLVSADGSEFTDAIYPYLLDHFRSDGGLFALPVDAGPTMIHYNPRVLSQDDVSRINEGWHWDDMVEIAEKLTERDENGEVQRWGLITQHQGYWWALWQNEAELADPITNQCRLLEPAAIEALQFCHDLIHTHQVSPPVTSFDAWSAFQSGSWPPMFFSSVQGNWSSDNRWAALPRGKQHSVPVIGNMGIAITDRAQNTEAALRRSRVWLVSCSVLWKCRRRRKQSPGWAIFARLCFPLRLRLSSTRWNTDGRYPLAEPCGLLCAR